MRALFFFPGRQPQLLHVAGNHLFSVAAALGTSASAIERVVYDGGNPDLVAIYYVGGDGQAGMDNPLAEAEAERLTGELCDFSGSYVFVYADDTLFPKQYSFLLARLA